MNRSYTNKDKEKEFLGQGLAFPFQRTPLGQLKLAGGEEDVQESIKIILGTEPGERLMRPEFGCRIYELLFDPYDIVTQGRIEHYVKEALARWEPRIDVQEVEIEPPGHEGQLLVKIFYTLKTTHDERSIVYPFYLMGEE